MRKVHTGTVVWEETVRRDVSAPKAVKKREFHAMNTFDTNEFFGGETESQTDMKQRTNARGRGASH